MGMKTMRKSIAIVVLLTSQMISCTHISKNENASRNLASTSSLFSDLTCYYKSEKAMNMSFGWPILNELVLNIAATEVYTLRKKVKSNGSIEWVQDYGAAGYIFTETGMYKYVEPPYSASATIRGCTSAESDSALTMIDLEGRKLIVQSAVVAGQIGNVYDGKTKKNLSDGTTAFSNCIWQNSIKQAVKNHAVEAEIIKMGEHAIHIDFDSMKTPYVKANKLEGEEFNIALDTLKKNYASIIDGIRSKYFYKIRQASQSSCKTSPEFPDEFKILEQGECLNTIYLKDEISKLKDLLQRCSMRFELDHRNCDDLKPN